MQFSRDSITRQADLEVYLWQTHGHKSPNSHPLR